MVYSFHTVSISSIILGVYRKDRGPMLSKYGPKQAWLTEIYIYMYSVLYDFVVRKESSRYFILSPKHRKYCTGNDQVY